MTEFIEECRREWKRLGVPDPIANEMAADLTADIDEAEAEGGSAEDVLGTSLFEPRRFAAAWAGARGVTAPPAAWSPPPLARREHQRWYRPALTLALVAAAFLTAVWRRRTHRRSSQHRRRRPGAPDPGGARIDWPVRSRAHSASVPLLCARTVRRRAEHRAVRHPGVCTAPHRHHWPRSCPPLLVPVVPMWH